GALAWRTEGGFLALAMICAGLSVTCGSAAIATAVMLLPERAEDDTGYGHMPARPERSEVRRAPTRTNTDRTPPRPSNAPHRIPDIPNKGGADGEK
ncbi:MAG TPA: hypothetical protein VLQ65_11015, partial [Saliniramus sp.]|nr:hypothetical protein [Saliniramus sp.]